MRKTNSLKYVIYISLVLNKMRSLVLNYIPTFIVDFYIITVIKS